MNNQLGPEFKHEADSETTAGIQTTKVMDNTEHITANRLPGWTKYSEAILCDDGKKRDQDGNIVEYPHHLVSP